MSRVLFMEKSSTESSQSWAVCQLVVLVKQTREFSSGNIRRLDLTPPAPLHPPCRSVDRCPPQEHLANKWNHSPMGTFPLGKTTSPTRSHLTEELYLLVRHIFLENEHKICLIPVCQRERACHCPLASPEHGFLPF